MAKGATFLLAVTLASSLVHVNCQAGSALGTLGVERGGSCGFTAAYPPAGVYIGALSRVLYGNGATCGACYQAACINNRQCLGARVTFTVVNECLGENTTSPCVTGRSGLSLQPQAFDVIASSRSPGIVPMRFVQVPCRVAGGVQFQVQSGNQYYFAVLIQNVAGPGGLAGVSISTNGRQFHAMTRSYGAVWAINNFDIRGAPLSFLLTGNTGQRVTLLNAIPAMWQAKATYTSLRNFPVPRA